MDLAGVMDEIAVALRTIPALTERTYAWPVASVVPPAAIVSYPDSIDWDRTYSRGSDRYTGLPVVIVEANPTDRATRDRIAAYCAGSGASSVKAAIQSGTYTKCGKPRVTKASFDTYTIGGNPYMVAIFELDITGPGA